MQFIINFLNYILAYFVPVNIEQRCCI